MEILIVGADSSIAQSTAIVLINKGCKVTTTSRRKKSCGKGRLFLDLMDKPDSWEITDADACMIAAAQTRLDVCEADPQSARRVNVDAVRDLVARYKDSNAFVLLLSTNQVFDGTCDFPTSEHPPCPTSVYGMQKAEAEKILMESSCPSAVLRLTKVLGAPTPLIESWRQDLLAGREINPFIDMVLSPLPMHTVAACAQKILMQKAEGIFQLSGDRDITYAAVAYKLAESLGVKSQLVRPIHAEEAGISPYMNPAHTTLDMSMISDRFSINAPSSSETVAHFMSSLHEG